MSMVLNYLVKILSDILTIPVDEIVYLPEDELTYEDYE